MTKIDITTSITRYAWARVQRAREIRRELAARHAARIAPR